MKKNILHFVYALAAFFIAAMPSASAQFTNPGFESGDLSGWTVDASAFASSGFNQQNWLVSPSGNFMAQVEPGGANMGSTEIFLGLTPGAFATYNPSIFSIVTNFGSIKQSVFLSAGQSVTTYWNYVSTDYDPYNDGVFATLVGPGGYEQIQIMAITANAYGSPGTIVTGSYGSTGWHTVTFTAGASGMYTLGLGGFNAYDVALNPILFVDDAAGGTSAPGQPVVITDVPTNVTITTATTGGNVTSDGGSFVTTRGVAYATHPLPTLSDNFTTDGNNTGTFVSNLTGLTGSTTYYVRAYATNAYGTSYGNEETFTTLSACNITASATATNAYCNGGTDGTIDLTVTGANGTVTYAWSNGGNTEDLSGLAAGTYTVTITDGNGCTATASATVGEPTALIASSTSTDALCFGGQGSVTVSATGGTGAYSGTGIFTIGAGTHTYVVTDINGCASSTSATVGQPTQLVASATATDVACNGGSDGTVTVTATGGTAPYTGTVTYSNLGAGTYTYTVTDANGCSAIAAATVGEPAVLVASSTATNALCNGGQGSITVTATGGTTPYSGTTTYNVGAGTYTYTVTDAHGCTSSTTATVTQPEALTASATTTPASCFGGNNGSVTVTATGGTTPYTGTVTYNNLTAGTYTYTVSDANGCSTTVTATVGQPTALALSATTTNNVCNGGTSGAIDLSVGGGTSPYTYLWNGGATTQDRTGLAAGTYTVTVTDAHACSATGTYTITQPAATGVSASITNVLCNGQSNGAIDVTITSGTSPYTYNWGGGVTTQDRTGLAAGTYTVTITNALGCVVTKTYTVTQPAPLVVTGTVTDVTCYGDHNGAIDVTVTGGTPGYTYKWADVNQNTYILWLIFYFNQWCNNNNSTWPGYNINTQDRSGLYPGFYWVQATDANGCKATANFDVDQPSPICTSISKTNVSCHGGSNGSVNLGVSGGVTPYTYQWSNGATTQDLSNVPAGTYSVTVTDAHGCTETASTTVTQPSTLNANIAVSPMYTVSGQAPYTIYLGYGTQTVQLQGSASGGTPGYSYDWAHTTNNNQNVNVSPTTTTTYTLTVTDCRGCTATATRTEIVKNVAAPGNNKVYVCHNGNTLSVSSSAVPAHLAHGDILGPCPGAMRRGGSNNGDDDHGHELAEFGGGDIKVYPNPNNGIFTVEVPMQGTTDVVITDVAGKVVYTQSLKDNVESKLQFNLGNEAKGLYFIKVKIGDGFFQSKVTLE